MVFSVLGSATHHGEAKVLQLIVANEINNPA